MSQISKENHYEVNALEQVSEPEQADECGVAVQSEEPCRSERAHTLTERGKEFQKEKTRGLLLHFDSIYDH